MKYVLLGNLSPEYASKQSERVKKAKAKLDKLGIKIESIHYTQGYYDFVDIVDAQFVELGLGLLDPLRLLACVLRAQISKQHIFHGYLHVVWIVLHEDLASIRLPASSAHAISFSKCDNRAAKVPHRSGASVGLRSSLKASACSQAPRLWSNYRPTAARSAKLVPTCRGM